MSTTTGTTYTLRNSKQYYTHSGNLHGQTILPKCEVYEEQPVNKHCNCPNNCKSELPQEGASVKTKSNKDMLERLSAVHADLESSFIPTDTSDNIARHEPNIAATYFVRTFDNSRIQCYK